MLRSRGVEVVQFDFLTPEAVAAYCQERGFLEVGGPARYSMLDTGYRAPRVLQVGWHTQISRKPMRC